ncbi:MAG: ABC transporter substrate-binding protein [Raoultibacter sp.]
MEDSKEMLTRRRFVELFLATGVMATGSIVLGGCSQKNAEPATEAPTQAEPVNTTIVDAKKREVTIPEKLDRIAITCNGGTTHEVAIFGSADKIVAQPSMKKFPQLLKMYPHFKDVVNAGSFDDLNIETLVTQQPDIALVGISSEKGNAQVEDVGIPTYVMLIGWAAIDTLKQEFLNVGKIVGNENQAEKLVKHWNDTLGNLAQKIEKIPQDKRKKVYYLSGAEITKANTGDWGRTWISTIGADFAVPESDLKGDVSVEKVMGWDPDVIIIQGGNNLDDLLNNEQLKDLKAIQQKTVYSCPIAGFWWDRPSPEATLGFLWLAQTVYPEYLKDIDLKKETMAFFKEFYSYSLSDEEYQAFF